MMQEYGHFIVSFPLLIILQSWKASKNFLLRCRSPLKTKGGFPLSAPLALLAMTFILGAFATAPVAVLTSAGWLVMIVSWEMGGSIAATGGMSTGMLVP